MNRTLSLAIAVALVLVGLALLINLLFAQHNWLFEVTTDWAGWVLVGGWWLAVLGGLWLWSDLIDGGQRTGA